MNFLTIYFCYFYVPTIRFLINTDNPRKMYKVGNNCHDHSFQLYNNNLQVVWTEPFYKTF